MGSDDSQLSEVSTGAGSDMEPQTTSATATPPNPAAATEGATAEIQKTRVRLTFGVRIEQECAQVKGD